MTAGEMIKFLRDHNVPNLLVKGDEVVHLIKSVNLKILCQKQDITQLNFLGF